MVSLWPFGKSDADSAAQFEKTLATLSKKIADSTNHLESVRQGGRRVKVVWTLYAVVFWLIYGVFCAVVVTLPRCTWIEHACFWGAPFVIYGIRYALASLYDYRTSRLQGQVIQLNRDRDQTISKLKAATKYDATQQLLDKYGGKPKREEDYEKPKKASRASMPMPGRINVPLPATANVPRNVSTSVPNSPAHVPPMQQQLLPRTAGPTIPNNWTQQPPQRSVLSPLNPDFVPASVNSHQYAQSHEGGKWYDRIVDALLGEDETSARNRLALICQNCKLVNGLAPPGARTLEGLGIWRCVECKAKNGTEKQQEARQLIDALASSNLSDGDRVAVDTSASDEQLAPTEAGPDPDEQISSAGYPALNDNEDDDEDEAHDTDDEDEQMAEKSKKDTSKGRKPKARDVHTLLKEKEEDTGSVRRRSKRVANQAD